MGCRRLIGGVSARNTRSPHWNSGGARDESTIYKRVRKVKGNQEVESGTQGW